MSDFGSKYLGLGVLGCEFFFFKILVSEPTSAQISHCLGAESLGEAFRAYFQDPSLQLRQRELGLCYLASAVWGLGFRGLGFRV